MTDSRRRCTADEGVFDLADKGLVAGDAFRWPNNTRVHLWRITEILDPDVDEEIQRVRAVRARPAGRVA